MSTPAVEILGLAHRYGEKEALRGVDLTVSPGSLVALLGPNGSGKTTLFRVLSTLLHPTAGTARVFGGDTTKEAEAVRRRLGVVFQQPALDGALGVEENLRIHGALYGLGGAALSERIDHLLTAFGMADRRRDAVRTLSGGLERRADLVRGLLHAPALLLLDEPTNGLDPAARHLFWTMLDRLRREEGTTIVVATHLMDEAERCDEVAILHEGALAANGPPEALKEELGSETLWLEADDVHRLAGAIAARFGLPARVYGRAVQISHPEAHTLLAPLYQAFGGEITSATVRRPTLEDVFLVRTKSETAPEARTTRPLSESR